jgi:hypothetical protein
MLSKDGGRKKNKDGQDDEGNANLEPLGQRSNAQSDEVQDKKV